VAILVASDAAAFVGAVAMALMPLDGVLSAVGALVFSLVVTISLMGTQRPRIRGS
jgi:hypothetical protein